MSEPKIDFELAYDLANILDEENIDLPRSKVEAIRDKLSAKGYCKGPRGLAASVSYLESIGATLADEFMPVYEAVKKAKFPRPTE